MNHIAKADTLLNDIRRLPNQGGNPVFQLKVFLDGPKACDSFEISENEVEGRIRGYVYEGFDVSIAMVSSKIEITVREPVKEPEYTVLCALPQIDIEEIVEVVRNQTEEVVISIVDEGNGVLVKTGVLHGHHWRLRKGKTIWKIIQRAQWCT